MISQSAILKQIKIYTANWKIGLDILICLAFFSAAIFVGFAATASGPGITPDSVNYISMGANLHQGDGFVSDLTGSFETQTLSPVTWWPPAYSLFIALAMFLGMGSVAAGKLVALVSLGLLLGVVYWLAYTLSGRLVAALSAAAVLSLMAILRAATFALSEMTFTLFITLAAAGFVQYVKAKNQRKRSWMVLAAISTALALLTRYIGIVFVFAGLVVIGIDAFIIVQDQPISIRIKRFSKEGILFALIAFIPIVPWFVRNQLLTGHLTGFNRLEGYHPTLFQNIRYAISTPLRDLVPSIHLGLRSLLSQNFLVKILLLLGSLVLVTVAVWVIKEWMRKIHSESSRSILNEETLGEHRVTLVAWSIPLIFISIYVFGLIVVTSTVLLPAYDWPRLMVVIYPLLLVGLFSSWGYFVSIFFKNVPDWTRMAITAILPVLLIIPYAVQSDGFISAAAQGQEYTTHVWRQNQGIQYLAGSASKKDIIYSDKAGVVSFWLNRPVKYLPYTNEAQQFTDFLNSHFNSPGVSLFFIVFKGDLGQPDPFLPQRITSEDLGTLVINGRNLKRVADFEDSIIYRLDY